MKINKILKDLKNADITSNVEVLSSTKSKKGFEILALNSDTDETQSIDVEGSLKDLIQLLKNVKEKEFDCIVIKYTGLVHAEHRVMADISVEINAKNKTIYIYEEADFDKI